MEVRVAGRVTEARAEQSEKALLGMVVRPSGTVACPCRYIHGPAAITTAEDLENTVKLVQAFIKRISS